MNVIIKLPIIKFHPSAITNRSILNGVDIVVGGSIIIPIDISVEDTTISITINGRYIRKPIINAILNSLIINDGIKTLNVISSSDLTEPSSYPDFKECIQILGRSLL